MGNIQWFDSAGVIAATASASSAQADSPVSRIVVAAPRFERPWRSTTTGAQSGTITFTGGSQAVVALVLYNVNFTTVTIHGTVYTVSPDLDGMYKLFKAVTFTTGSVAFSIPSQATTDGQTFFKIGRLLCIKTLSEGEECPESITREIFDPQITAESELGVFDTLPAGSPYSKESWSGKWTADSLPNIRALFGKRAHQWVGIFRNLSLTRDAEFLFHHKEGGTRITYGNITVDMDVNFRQAS